MHNKHRQARTRYSLTNPDSDSIGFVLAEDLPPEMVETTARYEILGELGRGGGGIVYKARDVALNRMVAVKVLRHEFMDRPEIVNRFEQEAQIICHLQHPGVAPVFECGTCDDNRPFYAMKMVNGQTMGKLIEQSLIDPDKRMHVVQAFANVCQTIAFTHSHNIVHLDLKPANFMIGMFGEVHVMDWGTARILDANGQYESVGMSKKCKEDASRLVGGTLAYMAPEQVMGGILDCRTDVFALGACLCQILTGSPPHEADNTTKVYKLAAACDLIPVHRKLMHSNADPTLIRLAINCLQNKPADRLRDAKEVSQEMSSYQGAALARFQSDMSRFFELSLDLFCIAGMDGFFRRLNSNFSRVLGYNDQDLLARPFMDFVHPDDHEKTVAAMSQLDEGKPVIRFHNRYLTAAGNYLEFEWTAKSIPDEGLIFAVARDVTES